MNTNFASTNWLRHTKYLSHAFRNGNCLLNLLQKREPNDTAYLYNIDSSENCVCTVRTFFNHQEPRQHTYCSPFLRILESKCQFLTKTFLVLFEASIMLEYNPICF